MSSETIKFVGWWRSGRGPWRRRVEAATSRDCLQVLISAVRREGLSVDLLVIPEGQDPNRKRQRQTAESSSGYNAGVRANR